MLLSAIFITCVPIILSGTKNIGIIKNIFSNAHKLISGTKKIEFLFIIYPKSINMTKAKLNDIKRGIVDNGVSYPIFSNKLFINNPNNIIKEMLNPIARTNFSVDPILPNLII